MASSTNLSGTVASALRRAWWPVARAKDLARPQPATQLGTDLVVFRAEGGGLAVLDNRCPHRGAGLALGEVVGDAIQCPYHGWAFDAAGECTRVPSLPAEGKIPPGAEVMAHPAVDYLGLVWTCLDEPALPRPDPVELHDIDWEFDAADVFESGAGVLATTENFRDVAHFAFVHRRTMGDVPAQIEPLNVERRGPEVFMKRWYTAHGGEGGEVWESSAEILYDYHTIAPAFVLLIHHYGERGRRYTIQACSPVTLESCRLYWVEGISTGFEGPSLDECIVANREVFLEDLPILESLRPREVPLGAGIEVSVPADRYTLAVRRAFLAFVKQATGGDAAFDGADRDLASAGGA